jgi:Putative Actinobacterial Holin-X, holin superfamily III
VTPGAAQDPAPAGARATEQDSSWAALGRGILEEVAAVARERLRLLALEGQQFALAAGQMLTLGVIAAVFVLTAWFVLVAGILAGVVQLGVPWVAALAGGVVLNLVAALLAWLAMRRLLGLMMFSATLRRMQFAHGAPSAAQRASANESLPPAGADPGGALEKAPAVADPTLRQTP